MNDVFAEKVRNKSTGKKSGIQREISLREWESVGIQLRPLGNAAYVACLPLLCHGSKWLNGKNIWLVSTRFWVQIQLDCISFPWLNGKNIWIVFTRSWVQIQLDCVSFPWLNGKNIWLVFRKSWVQIQLDRVSFLYLFLTLSAKTSI